MKNGLVLATAMGLCLSAHADENLFGYVKGAETLPEGAAELYQWVTVRDNKGQGDSPPSTGKPNMSAASPAASPPLRRWA